MILYDEDYNQIKTYVYLFEKKSFVDLKNVIPPFLTKDEKSLRFYNWLYELDILGFLSRHKNDLANLLIKSSRVVALPEDRTRIVFLLAEYSENNYQTVSDILKAEFGHPFKLFPKYNFGTKVIEWQRVAQRANEIRNGFYNHDRLQVDQMVHEIVDFYKFFKVNSEPTLQKLVDLSEEIISRASQLDFLSPNHPSVKNLLEKVIEFYKLSGRAKFDIDNLQNESNFENILRFSFMVKYACLARIHLMYDLISLDDLQAVYEYLSEYLATNYSHTYISADELARIGQPLQPIVN